MVSYTGVVNTLLVILILTQQTIRGRHHHGQEKAEGWSNRWIVELKSGHEAEDFAEERGLRLVEELYDFPGHYLLESLDRTEGEDSNLSKQLMDDLRVEWAEQQFSKVRVKRGFLRPEEPRLHGVGEPRLHLYDVGEPRLRLDGPGDALDLDEAGLRNILLKREILQSLEGKSIPEELIELWKEEENWDKPQPPDKSKELFNDELWDHQWYLHDTRTRAGLPDISLQVVGAWKKGVTGRGVNVVVVDDGLDHTHPDLHKNYDPSISFDFNSNDSDPMPRGKIHSHGTRCAGEIAMVPNNHLCGVGVAFNATIGGVRVLDGKISDELEGKALSWALDKVDIFSSSWGPDDDGKTVEGPGRLASKALELGVTKGRQGKGVIYVWASGNGGSKGDDCNCDGYTTSIYTLSVSSASEQGASTWYGESCPSTLTSTYSSGAYTDQKITTTDVGGGCTVSHTGTSAAAPLAAGIIALALEINPKLTWRDVQYLTVYNSDPAPVLQNDGWRTNGAGLLYNPVFGFGVLNAESMVSAAETWKNVPPSQTCQFSPPGNLKFPILGEGQSVIAVEFKVKNCTIKQLEHVQVQVTIQHPRRGDLDIVLRSPRKTATRLLSPRLHDDSSKGFYQWSFTSVETWGESPSGSWTLYIADRGREPSRDWHVDECRLTLRGIEEIRGDKDIRNLVNKSKLDLA